MRKNQVVFIYGAPACGKYTMAKRLSEENGFLLDNHYFHDMFQNLIEVSDDKIDIYFKGIGEVKRSFLDIIKQFYPKKNFVRYIFTSCIAEYELDNILKFQQFADDLNADFVPIELKADLEVLKKRCQTEYRRRRKKMYNPEKLERIVTQSFKKSPDYKHKNKIVIDTSSLNEDETFEKIKKHLKKFD